MPEPGYIAAAVAVAAALTWAARAAPFVVLAPMRNSDAVRYLSRHMPLGVMLILAVDTAHDAPLTGLAGLPFVCAVAVTVGLHVCAAAPCSASSAGRSSTSSWCRCSPRADRQPVDDVDVVRQGCRA